MERSDAAWLKWVAPYRWWIGMPMAVLGLGATGTGAAIAAINANAGRGQILDTVSGRMYQNAEGTLTSDRIGAYKNWERHLAEGKTTYDSNSPSGLAGKEIEGMDDVLFGTDLMVAGLCALAVGTAIKDGYGRAVTAGMLVGGAVYNRATGHSAFDSVSDLIGQFAM